MAMGGSNWAVVRFWCGPQTGDGYTAAEDAYDRLGSPYAVALELLNERLSEYTMLPGDVASASDRVNHAQNISAVRTRIGELVAFVNGNPDLSLSAAAITMFEQASASSGPGLVSVPVNFSNNRMT